MTVAKNNVMSPFTQVMDPETLDTIIIQLFIIHYSVSFSLIKGLILW